MQIHSMLLCAVLLSSTATAYAGPQHEAKPTRRSIAHRMGDWGKALPRRLSVIIAPTRIKTGSDGSIKSTRWGFSKNGRPIRKEVVTIMRDGSTIKRTLSYEKEHTGEKRLRADTVTQHGDAPKDAPDPVITTASLSDGNVVTEAAGDRMDGRASTPSISERPTLPKGATAPADVMIKGMSDSGGAKPKPKSAKSTPKKANERARAATATEHVAAKPMTLTRAYLRATWDSPVAHFAATTTFFYGFWQFLPWGFDATQAIKAALVTKLFVTPLVSWHAYKKLRLQTVDKISKTWGNWEGYFRGRAEQQEQESKPQGLARFWPHKGRNKGGPQ